MKARKISALLLAFGISCTALSGCSNSTATASDPASSPASSTASVSGGDAASAPQEEKPAASGSVKILTGVTGGKDEAEMAQFVAALSEGTGLEIVMDKPADYDQVLLQKLQGGEEYDLVYLNMNQYMSLIGQGALTDLTDFMGTSPIFSDPEKVDPQEIKDITVDGKVYAGFNKKELHRVVGLNKVHLDKAGIDYKAIEPTLDGYYTTFQKLKATMTDADYYPLDSIISENWDLQPWMAAAGLKGGVQTDADGKTYVPYSTDAAAPVWEWLRKLYAEGLLDPSSVVDKTKDMRAKMGATSQKVSCTVDWAAWIGIHNTNAAAENIATTDFEIVSLPGVKNPDGAYMLAKGNASLWGVPVNAANPEGAKKVLEYFATQEGGELISIGIKDNDYTVDNGKYTLTALGKTHGGDHGAPVPIFKGFINPVGYNVGLEEALTYAPYASIETPIANEADYKEIVGKWGVQMCKGDVTVADGLVSMRKELVARGVCEKE